MTIGPEPIRSMERMSVRFGISSYGALAGLRHGTDERPIGNRHWLHPASRAVVVLQGIRKPGFDLIDAGHVRRMGGQKFRNRLLRTKTHLADHLFRTPAHPLPERHRLAGIVAGFGHEPESDVIRFRLLLPVEGQRYIDSIGAQQSLNRTTARMP